jgi:hypothetical protein
MERKEDLKGRGRLKRKTRKTRKAIGYMHINC